MAMSFAWVLDYGCSAGKALLCLRPAPFVLAPSSFSSREPAPPDPSSYATPRQVAADQLPKLASMRDQLTERLSSIHGASVEDSTFSVSVHYRNCDPRNVEQVRRNGRGLPV